MCNGNECQVVIVTTLVKRQRNCVEIPVITLIDKVGETVEWKGRLLKVARNSQRILPLRGVGRGKLFVFGKRNLCLLDLAVLPSKWKRGNSEQVIRSADN